MAAANKGLKLMRTPGAVRVVTPPTKGSETQKRKAHRLSVQGESEAPCITRMKARQADYDKNCPKTGKMKFHRPGSRKK